MSYEPEQLRQWAEFVTWDEPDYRKPSVSDIRNQLDAHASALEDMAALVSLVRRYLATAAKPLGLAEIADIDAEARALLARMGE